MYAISTFLFWCASKLRGCISYVGYAIGVFCPCFIAAVRDTTIGTDLSGYGQIVYSRTKGISLIAAIQQNNDNPIGFVAFVWLVNVFGGSFQLYLFLVEIIVILPALLFMIHFLGEDAWFGMLIFLLTCYPASLNLMKQMMAVSLSLYAFTLAMERKYKMGIGIAVLALLMHQTAIMAFVAYPFYRFYANSGKYSLVRRITLNVAFLGGLLVFFAYSSTFIAMATHLKDSYSYIAQTQGQGSLFLSYLRYAFLSILVYVIFLMERGKPGADSSSAVLKDESALFSFSLYMSIVGCLIMETNVVALGVSRFAFYFLPYLGIFLGLLIKERKYVLTRLVVCAFLALIVYEETQSMMHGANEIYPYTSTILEGLGVSFLGH